MTHPHITRYTIGLSVAPDYRVGFDGYGDPALPELDMLNIRYLDQRDPVTLGIPYQHIDALIAGLQELRRVVSEGQEAAG